MDLLSRLRRWAGLGGVADAPEAMTDHDSIHE